METSRRSFLQLLGLSGVYAIIPKEIVPFIETFEEERINKLQTPPTNRMSLTLDFGDGGLFPVGSVDNVSLVPIHRFDIGISTKFDIGPKFSHLGIFRSPEPTHREYIIKGTLISHKGVEKAIDDITSQYDFCNPKYKAPPPKPSAVINLDFGKIQTENNLVKIRLDEVIVSGIDYETNCEAPRDQPITSYTLRLLAFTNVVAGVFNQKGSVIGTYNKLTT